jgi:hypothetical protein
MAQSDMNIANQGFPAFRADLNAALAALVSNSSGATAPSATFPHQFWVDTAASPSVLKQRNLADDAWVTIGTINETTGVFTLNPNSVDAYTKAQTYTKTEVDALAQTFTGISATTTGWTGSGPYTRVVTVTGLLATDSPIVDIDLSSVAFADVPDVQSDWGLVYRVAATAANQLTLYATDTPTENFTLTVKVVR